MEFDATFIVSIISFVVFVIIMNKILYQPILNIIEKRRLYFENNKNETDKNNEERDDLNKKYDNKLSDAHKTSREITSLGFQNAKKTKDEIIKNAKEQAHKDINDRLQLVSDEKNKTQEELNSQTDEISDLITSKLLKEGKNV